VLQCVAACCSVMHCIAICRQCLCKAFKMQQRGLSVSMYEPCISRLVCVCLHRVCVCVRKRPIPLEKCVRVCNNTFTCLCQCLCLYLCVYQDRMSSRLLNWQCKCKDKCVRACNNTFSCLCQSVCLYLCVYQDRMCSRLLNWQGANQVCI